MPGTFKDAIVLLGSPIFIGALISLLAAKWVQFNRLGDSAKFFIVGGISVGLPFLSKALLLYLPVNVVDTIEFWFPTLIAGLGVWASTQVWKLMFGTDGYFRK